MTIPQTDVDWPVALHAALLTDINDRAAESLHFVEAEFSPLSLCMVSRLNGE